MLLLSEKDKSVIKQQLLGLYSHKMVDMQLQLVYCIVRKGTNVALLYLILLAFYNYLRCSLFNGIPLLADSSESTW